MAPIRAFADGFRRPKKEEEEEEEEEEEVPIKRSRRLENIDV